MLGVKVDVIPPTERDDAEHTPLAISELAGWQIYTQIQGAQSWSPIGGLNDPSVTTRTIGNVTEGTLLNVRTTWFDKQTPQKEGLPSEGQILVDVVTPPEVLAAPGRGGMSLSVVPG